MMSSRALDARATGRGLFTAIRPAQPTRVRLYADRIKPRGNRLGQKWTYVGLLAVPDEHYGEALRSLEQGRVEGGYSGEVHFVELKSPSGTPHGKKTAVARHWVNAVLWDERKILHFYLLGLNLSKLEHSAFGSGWEKHRNIYNRFFRSAVAYILKAFFGAEKPVRVSHIFHDKDEVEEDALFNRHTISRLSSPEDGITFETATIQFIDSDHEKERSFPRDSHFIQLTDVLTGAMAQCLDDPNNKSGCCEVAECLLPLMERLTDPKRVRNRNSRFRHVNRICVAFFPKEKLSLRQLGDRIQRARSGLYIQRPLLFAQRISGQLPLEL